MNEIETCKTANILITKYKVIEADGIKHDDKERKFNHRNRDRMMG